MPHTVHTLDGQAHTYPDCTAYLADNGALRMHEGYDTNVYGDVELGPLLATYPAGQWTHYHVEPTPYETDYSNTDEDEERQEVEGRLTVSVEERDKWQASFQRHLDAGRKAARAR